MHQRKHLESNTSPNAGCILGVTLLAVMELTMDGNLGNFAFPDAFHPGLMQKHVIVCEGMNGSAVIV